MISKTCTAADEGVVASGEGQHICVAEISRIRSERLQAGGTR